MTHPTIVSAVLIEREGRVLVVHRKPARKPLANQWLLPLAPVAQSETAEAAVKRHARDQFGVDVTGEAFADTVYIEDPDDKEQYVANIFRAQVVGGPMRFRADGDYDDARWLGAGDLDQLWMPPVVRESAKKLLSEPAEPSNLDWTVPAPTTAAVPASVSGQAVPLAERVTQDEANATAHEREVSAHAAAGAQSSDAEAPDNRAAWDAISKAYQDDVFGERFPGKLMWSWTISEDDVHLLDDVSGKHAIVLGCGGGQDVIALCEMGAIAVGVDQSEQQIAYARKLATKRSASNASFVVGSVHDLSRFHDRSFDAAVSAHVLNYVERIDETLAEAARILRPGGIFALSIQHPFNAMLAEGTPPAAKRPYWDAQQDWTWDFDGKASGRFRSWHRPVSEWFDLLTGAGFTIERLLELREALEADPHNRERARMVPYSLAFKARKQ